MICKSTKMLRPRGVTYQNQQGSGPPPFVIQQSVVELDLISALTSLSLSRLIRCINHTGISIQESDWIITLVVRFHCLPYDFSGNLLRVIQNDISSIKKSQVFLKITKQKLKSFMYVMISVNSIFFINKLKKKLDTRYYCIKKWTPPASYGHVTPLLRPSK